jgi:hypothetical protein
MIAMPYHRSLRALLLSALALICCTAAVLAYAQADSETLERRVKAAFLYKFADYVEWPEGTFAQADSPLTIAVVGDDQIAAELAELVSGRKIDGRALAVRRTREIEAVGDAQIVFIGRAFNARLAQAMRASPAKPALVVTEAEGALAQGSVINFVLVDGRVRFEVSLEAAEKKGLRVSSRLLTVAVNVRGAR